MASNFIGNIQADTLSVTGASTFTGAIGNATTTVPSVMIGVSTANDPQIQLTGNGVNPHIDFSNTAGQDYDIRLINDAANQLRLIGGDMRFDSNVLVNGDLKMVGTDSYIWSPGTGSSYTGFYDTSFGVAAQWSETHNGWGIGQVAKSGYMMSVNGKGEFIASNQPLQITGTGNGAWIDYQGTSGSMFSMGKQGPEVFQLYNRTAAKGLLSVDSTGIITHTPTASLGTTQWSVSKASDVVQSNGNVSHLETMQVRTTAGADWTFTGTRIQQRIDSTYQGYLQFNGTAGNYGVSIGTGGGTTGTQSATDSLIISSTGDVSVPRGELSIGLTGGYSSTTKLNIATAGQNVPLSGAHGRTNYGDIHLEPTSGTSTYGNAITFGARDTTGVQAHIGTQSDGTFGTKMVFGTTSSYATGSQVKLVIDHAGNASFTASVTAAGDITAYSDERLKSEIVTFPDALDTVRSLRGVKYIKDGKASTGVIAQEVEAVIPEVVHTADDEMGTKSVAYGNMMGAMIEAMKEMANKMDAMQAHINSLEEKLNGK